MARHVRTVHDGGGASIVCRPRLASSTRKIDERLMTIRTTETTITFKHPFLLKAFDRPQPAGTYRLILEDEDIPDLTFLAYRRTATMLHIPAISNSSRSEQVFHVDSAELAAAFEADEHA
jgi:hypothetical protein